MTDRITVLRRDDGSVDGWGFSCPGCRAGHAFWADRGWTFNGDLERPTFSPSLVNWRPLEAKSPDDAEHRCHLYLRDGQLQFLPDCTHELAGQVVPCEPL